MTPRVRRFLFAVLACAALSLSLHAQAQGPSRVVTVRDSDGLRVALAAAQPGMRIALAPGEYAGGYWITRLRGEAGRPIVIAAADPQRPPVIRGGGVGFQFQGASYLQLRDLWIADTVGDGLMLDDGGARGHPMHDVLVHGLRFLNIGPRGNFHGIKMAGVDNFRIEDCRFEGWGAGDGLAVDCVGCHHGVLDGNTFRDREAPADRGFGALQFKGGSRDIVIQRNRFERTGSVGINIGGSTGLEFFRPTLDTWPAGEARYEAKDIRVEGNTFVGSTAPLAFINVDGAVVRFNTIYHPEGWALRILQETALPGFVPSRGGVFSDNIIVFQKQHWLEGGVNVGGGTAPTTFRFARNVWFCADDPADSRPTLPVAETGGVYGKDPLFRDAASGDLRLRPDSPARGAGAQALPPGP